LFYAERMEHDPIAVIRHKYQMLCPFMNERMRRLWTSAEAQLIGRGGITLVSKATGVAHTTIRRGIRELTEQPEGGLPQSRIRRPGGGRKKIIETDPQLLEAL